MNKTRAIEVAKPYFQNHKVDELFVTSDEQVFFSKQSAENHSSSFAKDSREVADVTREEAEAEVRESKQKIEVSAEEKLANAKAAEAQAKSNLEALETKLAAETDKQKKKVIQKAIDKAKTKLESASTAVQELSAE